MIIEIPEVVLQNAVASVKDGKSYTIHVQTKFIPKENQEAIPEEFSLEESDVGDIIKGEPLTQQEIDRIIKGN